MKDNVSFLVIRKAQVNHDNHLDYDVLYREGDLAQTQSFYAWFVKKMKVENRGRLVDIASGEGSFVKTASLAGFDAFGFDISWVISKHANLINRGRIWTADGENIPLFGNTVDFVTSLGSLEHYEHMDKGVQEMARILNPTGKAFILVPNLFSILTNVFCVFKNGEVSYDEQPLQRYATKKTWIDLLESNGLRVIRVEKYERAYPRSTSDWKYYLNRPKQMVRLLATPFIPVNLAWCFLFECQKK